MQSEIKNFFETNQAEVKPFTRQDYMNNKCSHRDYFAQLITGAIKTYVRTKYKRETLIACYKLDKHLNNLGAGWMQHIDMCGSMGVSYMTTKINNIGCTRSDVVCTVKAYMQSWILNKNA
jgi:hypothetical protein